MKITPFYDKITATLTYVVEDEATHHCAIIDPVLNYDPNTGKITTESAHELIQYIENKNLHLEWILETHIHADHLTAAHYIKEHLGGKIGIGEHIITVLKYWVKRFNTQNDTPCDGSQFDVLFKDNDVFQLGHLSIKALHTPGHTPSCLSYAVENAVFVGDTIFMPYGGTSRTDFPGGSANTLYESIQRILSLGDDIEIYTGHDYPQEGEPAQFKSTVAEQKKSNIMINDSISKSSYIEKREARNKVLPVPRLLLPAIQMNLRTGEIPRAEDNGLSYIKIPLNLI